MDASRLGLAREIEEIKMAIVQRGKRVSAAPGRNLPVGNVRAYPQAAFPRVEAELWSVPNARLFTDTFYRRLGKRAFDLVFGAALIVALLPLMLATALVVLVTSGWPVLYRAERLGRHGQPFRMLKFRTMVRGADEALPALLLSDGALAEEYGHALKLRDDPRTTRLGALLRRFSIDELPQLWHVITGEMSLVGPRPYAATEAEMALIAPHPEILEPAPALTGPWQVEGRNDLTPAERIARDTEYAGACSFLGDVAYLLATVKCLVYANGR